MKDLILPILIGIFLNNAQAQNISFDWASNMGSTAYDQAYAVTTDAAGNVITTGYFRGTVDFDPGVGSFQLTTNGLFDVFVQKLDEDGNFLWATASGGLKGDEGYSVVTDLSGNTYITGRFVDSADFDPGPGVLQLISNGGIDVFVQKLDPNGNLLWAVNMGGPASDYGQEIVLDAAGNVYTTGWFGDTADFDPGPDTLHLISDDQSADVFVQKMDPNGNLIWARSFGADETDNGYGLTVDATGNVFTTGRFEGTVDFDPGPGTALLTSLGDYDVFIQKLDATGNFVWARSVGGQDYDWGRSIALDPIGNVLITGFFGSTVDFDPGVGTVVLTSNGQDDVFALKLDPNGDYLWAVGFGGADDDQGAGIDSDASGFVYLTGYYQGTVDFDPSNSGNLPITAEGSTDIFIQILDPSGALVWPNTYGGNDDDECFDIHVDASGNTLMAGSFEGVANFDPAIFPAYELVSNGQYDAFVHRSEALSTAIVENSAAGIDLFPNPSSGMVYLQLDEPQDVQISVYDPIGRIVRYYDVQDRGLVQIDLHGLSGVHLIDVRTEEGIQQFKLILD